MRTVIPRVEQLRRERRESPIFSPASHPWMIRFLDGFAAGDSGRSVAVASLAADGPVLAVRGATARPAASVAKLALVAAVLEAAHHGRLDLTRRVHRKEIGGAKWPSLLDALPADARFSLAELCVFAIVTSDNGAANYLCRTLGCDAVNAWMRGIGCSTTASMAAGFDDDAVEQCGRQNTITAEDLVLILRAIFHRPLYDPLLLALVNNVRNQRIPRLLDDVFWVAHKTGTLDGVVNDAGIIFIADAPLIAVFLCDGQSDSERAEGEIAHHALRLVRFALDQPG